MRRRVLEQSKSRIDFWKVRIDIQEKTLSKEKFELAKDEWTCPPSETNG